jgi:hypothetical protein
MHLEYKDGYISFVNFDKLLADVVFCNSHVYIACTNLSFLLQILFHYEE